MVGATALRRLRWDRFISDGVQRLVQFTVMRQMMRSVRAWAYATRCVLPDTQCCRQLSSYIFTTIPQSHRSARLFYFQHHHSHHHSFITPSDLFLSYSLNNPANRTQNLPIPAHSLQVFPARTIPYTLLIIMPSPSTALLPTPRLFFLPLPPLPELNFPSAPFLSLPRSC